MTTISKTKMTCRYCLDNDLEFTLIKPCRCSGTNDSVHIYCLLKWLWISKTTHCPVCNTDLKNKELWYVVTMLSMVCNLILNFGVVLYEYLFDS